MNRVNFDPLTPFGTHVLQSVLASSNRLMSSTVPKQTEAPRRVFDCVRTGGHNVRWETSGGRAQDGLECISHIDRKTGELRGSVLQVRAGRVLLQ